MNNLMKVEYDLFLEGYTPKQIAKLVDSSVFFVKRNLNKMLKKIDKEKTFIKSKKVRISFN